MSAGSFIEAVVEQWKRHKLEERERFMKVFHEFDENEDGVLQLHE